jgi:hypothetical protein
MGTRDEEEWFRKFYEGTFLIKGWKSRMKEVLQPFSPAERDKMRGQLDNLGEKIGREWAKDNKVRRVDTPMLQKWGKDLQNAKEKGADVLAQTIQDLNTEVDNVIA